MLAFTFPGQGSQKHGMGAPWVDHPSWEVVDAASEVAGRDLAALLVDADDDELKETRNAQLATFVTSLVALDAVERAGLAPAVCAGHSLGEYTALVATGVLSFDEGVKVVGERGDAMQSASEDQPGTMAAVIGLDDDDVDAALARADGDVWVANYNAPGQVVIAGTEAAVGAAGEAVKELGAKRFMPLPVGGAFHTPFMNPARDRLHKALADAGRRDAKVPVVANVDARPHTEASEWKDLLTAQLCSPVRWRQTLQQLADGGVTTLIEIGPGNVLTGLAKRTVRDLQRVSVSAPEDIDELLSSLDDDGPTGDVDHEGEHLDVAERLIVSPAAGVFDPEPSSHETTAGEVIQVGGLLGWVAGHEVRSPFAGWLMGMLALPGERVTPGQPIAWLRAL